MRYNYLIVNCKKKIFEKSKKKHLTKIPLFKKRGFVFIYKEIWSRKEYKNYAKENKIFYTDNFKTKY